MYYNLPNGKSFAHMSRSCTSTLAAHVLKDYYPELHKQWKVENCHAPQWYLQETWTSRLPTNCLVMARNPVERLESLLARNNYSEEIVEFCLDLAWRHGKTNRRVSKMVSMCRMHHIMPLDSIAENDSHFIKFPDVEQACEYLGLNYDSTIKVNTQRGTVTPLPQKYIKRLQDAIGIWEAL